MWVDKTRVYAAKAIDNEYAYGRLNAGQQPIYNRPWNKCVLLIYQYFSTRLQFLNHWFYGRAIFYLRYFSYFYEIALPISKASFSFVLPSISFGTVKPPAKTFPAKRAFSKQSIQPCTPFKAPSSTYASSSAAVVRR